MTFRHVSGAIERIWATYPAIGIIVLFAALGYGIYQGSQAKTYAREARQNAADAKTASTENGRLLTEKLADKDSIIAAKDAQLAEKDGEIKQRDTAIAGQVNIIGQLYNDAVALQQQVLALHGKPLAIPVTLPSPSPPGTARVPSGTQTTRPGVGANSPPGIPAAIPSGNPSDGSVVRPAASKCQGPIFGLLPCGFGIHF